MKPEPKSRPILFSGPMVRALLADTKKMTRRIVKLKPTFDERSGLSWKRGTYGIRLDGKSYLDEFVKECPYGTVGDRLWVRETWATSAAYDSYKPSKLTVNSDPWFYRADGEGGEDRGKWRPSIFMRTFISRITLEITGVRIERVQDISEEDAKEEGCIPDDQSLNPNEIGPAASIFESLWKSINGPDSWDANPWVWVIQFKRVEGTK